MGVVSAGRMDHERDAARDEPDALDTHPYAAFLARMQKPGRYLGGEEQAILKSHESLVCRFVLAFPDLYEIGMSHLGTRMLTWEGGKPAEKKACGSPGRDVDARHSRIDLETTEQPNTQHHRQSVRARATLLRWAK